MKSLKYSTMSDSKIYERLTELTEGLLYISETESEFSVYEVEPGEMEGINSFMEDIADMPAISFKEEDTPAFFEGLLSSMNVDDKIMQQLNGRYEALFAYLQHTFKSIRVVTAGDVERHIFIICCTAEPGCFLLHTIAVET